jgi:hypothetical protein
MTRPAATGLSTEPLRVLLIEYNPGDARLIRETLKDIKDFRFTLEHVDLLAEGLKGPQTAIPMISIWQVMARTCRL